MIVIEVFTRNTDFGLKSVNVSLLITTDLSPWLLSGLKNWALALNCSLLIIPDTQISLIFCGLVRMAV